MAPATTPEVIDEMAVAGALGGSKAPGGGANSSSKSRSNSLVWHVHKFGGTSVANAACFEQVRAIFERQLRPGHPVAMVLSAMGSQDGRKTTDLLLDAVSQAARQDARAAGVRRVRACDAARAAACRHKRAGPWGPTRAQL